MAGVKGMSKGKSGGARPGAGRHGKEAIGEERRTKILAGVLTETFALLRLEAARREKGRSASPSGYGALILDSWALKGRLIGEKKVAAELPPPYSTRRLQVTCWVKKSTALEIHRRALDRDSSPNAVSGEILDIWAKLNAEKLKPEPEAQSA